MSYKIVLDASTLILLAKVELLSLLLEAGPAGVTPEVAEEATRRQDLLDARLIADRIVSRKIQVQKAEGELTRHFMRDFGLDRGEASSIALAKTSGVILGTDDGLAIKACNLLGVSVVAALRILVRAYERGRLDQAMALLKLEKLQRFGRYDTRILEEAMRSVQGRGGRVP